MSDMMVRAKIEKYLCVPMDARWERWKSSAEADAFVEDACRLLGRCDGETLTAALLRVWDGWKYARRPRVSEISDAVRAISAEKPSATAKGEDGKIEPWRVDKEAHEYAGWFMWNTPEGRASWSGGYPHELRDWVTHEAAQQLFRGMAEPSVRVPAERIAEWQAAVERGRKAHDELLRARGTLRSLGEIVKQPHAAEAAE